ncbi:glycoside hydrolase superfamily [Rhypophila decipiens]|uniref:chitinase n=1 Tax=Rhypophila decipiens TaxID=261697 RepID=A0AAN6XXV7_9PEZI|nr:glycoside hydrolase superfamily [Rhypophila decipiens]
MYTRREGTVQQVPGTKRPTNGASLAALNPCPLNVCCNHWGQCGTTKEFCDITDSETGAPGTTMCVSNCGTDIIMSPPAASQMRIAYFSAWNANRPCLNMNVDQIPTGWYTHIHFAFAELTPAFEVDISHVQDEWDRFMAMKGIKKIVSFGGWDFSVLPGTYKILRDAIKAENRETFRRNVVNFVNQYNLDGVDLDWEYPGAPDMPIIPAGDPEEGMDYSIWLRSIRDSLPPSKSVSFAAPASFWYLKTFPISTMASYIDYVVYMTYDLHGQWDAGNQWSIDGCKAGDCLRSHVNLTETMGALSMLTKAGMPSNKVVVGVTSYGRSFRMAQLDCDGPMCRFTGTRDESHAEPGRCTETRGYQYISNAEIDEIIRTNPTARTWEKDMTDYLVYNQYDWVGYMSGKNKRLRELLYEILHMRGSTDWAVDLQSMDYGFLYGQDSLNPNELEAVAELSQSCDDRSFATLEELEKAGLPAHCVDGYVLEVLASTLEDGLSAYDAILRTDYDAKFGYFATAVKETCKQMSMQFYYDDDTDNDNWYLCSQVGTGKKLPCPPKGKEGSSVRMAVKDDEEFANHLMSELGIAFNDTEAGVIPRNLAGCLPIYTGNPLSPTDCVLPFPASSTVEGLRVIREGLVIPNPKDAVGEALGNLRPLPAYLRQVAKWERLRVLGSDLRASDVIDTSGPGIFMVLESVDAMKKAYDIGKDAEEEEKKRKRENIIMWVLSAILFILPGAGQALASFTRIAMIGRIASIGTYTDGVTMSAYEIAKDTDNLVLGIFFLLVDLISWCRTRSNKHQQPIPISRCKLAWSTATF